MDKTSVNYMRNGTRKYSSQAMVEIMANKQDPHDLCADPTDETEFCGSSSDVTIWSTSCFILGVVLGILCITMSGWCHSAITFLLLKWKERRAHKIAQTNQTTPDVTSQEKVDEEEEAEIFETTEIFTNIPVSNNISPDGSDSSKIKSSWAFLNGSPTQEETVRVLTRRIRELEERESVNSRLLLTVQRKLRHLETSSASSGKRTQSLMDGGNLSNDVPAIHALMLKLCYMDQKMSQMQKSEKDIVQQPDGNHKSLIQYTHVAPKDKGRKYIDLRPFYTSTRPSAFTVPYSPLYQRRWHCEE